MSTDPVIHIKFGQPLNAAATWGDFYFAYALKAAFARLGVKACPLFRDALHARCKFEIVLLGTGMADYRPPAGNVSTAWLISHPEENGPRTLELFSKAFVCSSLLSRSWGFEHLAQAYDADAFFGGPDKSGGKAFDIAFVGNTRCPERARLVSRLSSALDGVHLWGRHPVALRASYHAAAAPAAIGNVYRRSKIVIGHHLEPARKSGMINDRVYSAIASGAFVLSDTVEEIGKTFPAIVAYSDPDQAVELCAAFLADAPERRRVAELCAAANKDNSFDDRARRLLGVFHQLY